MSNPLHIALYYPARLPVVGYGGTERVVVWLAKGLMELGNRVTLLALPGSELSGTNCVTVEPREALSKNGFRIERYLPPDIDLLHSHVPLKPPAGLPYLSTFHGTGKPGRVFPDSTVGLSRAHAKRHGLKNWVHNGLDPSEYRFNPAEKQDFDLFLGRLHSVKGWQWAIEGARRTGNKLKLAGGWRPSLRSGIRFVGKVGGEKKRALLAQASCLWMPARWDEPFGLTTIEAMVSGTPVLGTRRGALPEIITPLSGAMGDTVEELVEARPALDKLDPESVRANVLDRFTHTVMAAAYLKLYKAEIGRG